MDKQQYTSEHNNDEQKQPRENNGEYKHPS